MRIYLINTYEENEWRTVRWFSNLDKLDRRMLACGYIKVDGDSYMWKVKDATEEIPYAIVTTAELE